MCARQSPNEQNPHLRFIKWSNYHFHLTRLCFLYLRNWKVQEDEILPPLMLLSQSLVLILP